MLENLMSNFSQAAMKLLSRASITYTPKGGAAISLYALYNSVPMEMETQEGVQMDISNIVFHVRRAELVSGGSAVVPKRGDAIVFDSKSYLVIGPEMDGVFWAIHAQKVEYTEKA